MNLGLSPTVRKLKVEFNDRSDLIKMFLSETPHGGLMVTVPEPVQLGEVVQLRVLCKDEILDESIRGVILWSRKAKPQGSIIGIGFFASEVDKRERLLSKPQKHSVSKERKNTRYQTTLKVTYQTATDFVIDYTRNISSGGFFVKSTQMPDVGAEILFRLYPPGHDTPIDLAGKVTWQRPSGGFGVRFTRSSDASRNQLAQLVRTVAIGAPAVLSAPIFDEVTPV
ncbi:MAG: PilZ domain-containing protein [Deltaproteobacteria bacterium]|nr:PilZ domain-containing protein [Deltaproteobacteria bacterium]